MGALATGLVAGIGSGAWGAVLAAVLPVWGRWFDSHWYTAAFVFMTVVPCSVSHAGIC